MKNVLVFLFGAFLTWIALSWISEGKVTKLQFELDSLRTEELNARLDAQGWQTTFADETRELEARIQAERDRVALLVEEKAALAREVEILGGRLVALGDLYAAAQARIIALGEAHGTNAQPDSVVAELDDGLLSGRVAYFPPLSTFDLMYNVDLGISVVVAEAPDGRGLISLLPEDSRVNLSYGEVLYQRPEPVPYCSLSEKGKYAAVGAGLLQLLRIVNE